MAELVLNRREDLIKILSGMSFERLESIWEEVKLKKHVKHIIPKSIDMEEVIKLKGLVSLGGDALNDSERLYDE
ncbi:MAG: hypothetical protein AB1567_08865 [bacterium]